MLKNTQYIASLEYLGGESQEEVFQWFAAENYVENNKNYIIIFCTDTSAWDLYEILL